VLNIEKNVKNERSYNNAMNYFKVIFFSTLGFVLFFIPVKVGGVSSIPIDHIVTGIKTNFQGFTFFYCIIIVFLGAALPFYDKSWNKNKINMILSALKLLGCVFATMFLFNIGPDSLMNEKMIPFLFKTISYPVALVVPIGAALLALIVDYGLLELLGTLMRPVMRPVWKVPGSASVTAVASFVGSFSVGIFLTNQLYKEGKYTKKEAAIVMTGFSTVSATFMVIVAKTLGLMDQWSMFFLSALVITFGTSAIVARLYPLRKIPNEYYNGIDNSDDEGIGEKNLFKAGMNEALKTADAAIPVHISLFQNFKDGLLIIMRLLPLMISIGTISFVLVYNTNVFQIIGYLYYPVLKLLQVPDAMLVAKASALAGAEMFIPAAIAAGAGAAPLAMFIVGMVSVSAILFFVGTIPVILATDIELSLKDMLIILVERTYIVIILAAIIGHFLL
jgi:nucleoside recognition membrane protein YjiH